MRRLTVLIMLSVVGLISAPLVAGTFTQNLTATATIAEATWTSGNLGTGAGETGGIQVVRENGEVTATFDRSVGALVLCEGGDTPDPADDFYGFVGTDSSGAGTAALSVGRQFRSARATGLIQASVRTFNECTGDEGTTTQRTISFTVTLAGAGPLQHQSTRSTLRVPSQVTAQQQVRGLVRFASGTVKLGSVSIDADGSIGQVTLKSHVALH